MGIVAAAAQGFVDRVTAVGLFERGLRAVVAAKAENGVGLDEKIFLLRAVGKVTGAASLGGEERLMEDLLFVPFFLVARKT